MKKFLKSDLGFCIANMLCIAGMFGVVATFSSVLDQLDVMPFLAWWCLSIAGTMMFPFCKEF